MRLSFFSRFLVTIPLSTLAQPQAVSQQIHDTDFLLVQFGEQSHVCNDIEQRYITNKNQINNRILNSLLFDAADRGCLELTKQFIIEGASVKARDRFGNTALLHAARSGHNDVITFLLDSGSELDHQNLAGSTALLRAVSANRRRTVKMLLQHGADPNTANTHGITPLLAAAFNGSDRIVQILVSAQADVNARDRTGKSAIVYAAGKGFTKIVELLLGAGVDVNAVYGNDLTTLMWAAGHSNDTPESEGVETVKLLLDNGANFRLTDNRGRTALMIAAQSGHSKIVSLLVAGGADPDRRDLTGKSARDLATGSSTQRALKN